MTAIDEQGKDYNLSPRMQFAGSGLSYYGGSATVAVMFMDTDQEKKIGLGANYPYDALGAGECIVPDLYSSKGVEIG